MDKRLLELSARLDNLIQFFDPEIFGRIPSLSGAGQVVKDKTGSALDALRSKLAASSAAKAQGRASSAAAQVKAGGIRDYFARSSFDRPSPGSPTGPFHAMGGTTAAGPAVSAPMAAAPVASAPVNPGIPTPVGAPAGMGRPQATTQAAGAVSAANAAANPAQTAKAPWWKNKYAAGAGIAAGAGAGGYLYGRSQQQSYSSWLDDIIHFDRGKFISKNVIDPDPLIGERFKTFLKGVAGKQGGKTRKEFRDLLAMAGKSKIGPRGLKAGPSRPKIFESAEEPIWFDGRARDPEGRFTPTEGGPDPNAMATVYKQPMQQGGGPFSTVAKGAGLALAGGALGQIGGEIGKQATSKVKALLRKAKDMAKK